MTLDRTFQFRGDRRYLHSTTLFDDLLLVRGLNSTHIDMKFHRKTKKQVSYIDKPPSSLHEPVAEWNDSEGKVYVVERDEPIQDSTPYDEPSLVKMLETSDRTVKIPAITASFTKIEALIAGFKYLLQTVYPTVERKYVFVRIRLDHCPDNAVEIRYSRDIGGFFQGDILVEGQKIGQIFFGVWE